MGKGGGGSSEPQVINPDRPNIPNESNLVAAAIARTLSASPYTLSPYRAMDYLHGLPSSNIQVPQFPGNMMAWGGNFNPGYGGGGYQQPTDMGMGGMMQHPQMQHPPPQMMEQFQQAQQPMQYPYFWGGMG